MKKLAKYNFETGIVSGYFIKGETYFGNVIDEVTKTIDGHPYIEIDESAQVLGKDMCVIDGVYQEYLKPLNEQLQEAKLTKLAQLKNNLINAKELETPRKGSLESYEIDGVFRTFKVKLSDLATVVARVSRLEKAAVGTTAQWTDVDDNRLNLNLEQFQCLRNHLDVRDQSLHTLYEAIKSEIKACTTLEELEAIEITF